MTNKLVETIEENFRGLYAIIDPDDIVTLQLVLLLFMNADLNEFKASVEIFKKAGSIPNYSSLLVECCSESNHIFNDHMEYLISEGADINAVGKDGTSCLHHLAWSGNLEFLKRFVEYGADILYRDHNMGDIYTYLQRYQDENTLDDYVKNSDDEELPDEMDNNLNGDSKNSDDEELPDEMDNIVNNESIKQEVENIRVFIRQKEIELVAKLRDIEKKYYALAKMIDGKGISIEI
jgi:ankyrin repeat protein